MKKVLSLVLVCVMLLTLAACGKDEPQTTDPSVAPSQAATGNTEKPAGNPETTQNPDKTPSEPTYNPSAPTETPDESPDAPTDTPNDTPVDTPAQPDEDKPTACSHSWTAATCTKAKTCSKCGATEGSTSDHDWSAATCKAPKTCKNCNVTEGALADHNWKDATYTAPKTCSVCGATEGDALPVTWTFTDGGDHIIATSQAGTKNIPLDTSHLPQEYETATEKQTVEVRRGNFRYVNGWVAFYEEYETHLSWVDSTAGGGVTAPGYTVMVKMDGSAQKVLKDIDAVAGYVDGYIYYIKLEGMAISGIKETQELYKCTFSENGDFGQECFIAELDGFNVVYTAWIEDGWLYYSWSIYWGEEKMIIIDTYKIRLDGTQNQQVTQ